MSRYIDAEQFKRDNERLLHCDFPYLAEETLEELIDNAPAADVAEVRRGRWHRDFILLTCSECGSSVPEMNGEWHYCPNCGASMQGEEE